MTTVSYTVSRREYFRVSLQTFSFNRTLKSIFGVLFILSLIISVFNKPSPSEGLLVLIPVAIAASLLFALIVSLISVATILILVAFRLRSKSPLIDSEINFSFSPENLITQTSLAKTDLKWEFVRQAQSTGNYFLLETSQPNRQVIFIPKRAFSQDQLKEFEELLHQKHLLSLKPPRSIRGFIIIVLLTIIVCVLISGLVLIAGIYFALNCFSSDSYMCKTFAPGYRLSVPTSVPSPTSNVSSNSNFDLLGQIKAWSPNVQWRDIQPLSLWDNQTSTYLAGFSLVGTVVSDSPSPDNLPVVLDAGTIAKMGWQPSLRTPSSGPLDQKSARFTRLLPNNTQQVLQYSTSVESSQKGNCPCVLTYHIFLSYPIQYHTAPVPTSSVTDFTPTPIPHTSP